MTTFLLATSVFGILAAFAAAMWWIGKLGAAQDKGAQTIRDTIKTEALDAKKREAHDYAAYRPDDWRDTVRRMQKPD